jgi:translation elongation factor EF-Tu-like GTPase
MITLISKIKVFEGGRKTALQSGYRPLFNSVNAPTKISGRMDLIDMSHFEPGRTDMVKITFHRGIISDNYFKIGERFTFDEGLKGSIGEGEIIQIISKG